MEQVLIKQLTLNDVVIGEYLPFRMFRMQVYRVESIFPFVSKLHLVFTPPDAYWECYESLRDVCEAQKPMMLTVTLTTSDQVFRFPGYLIWCDLECPKEEDDGSREIELEIVKPLASQDT